MQLKKHLINVGRTSKGVIIPKVYLDFLEAKHGKIDAISMEIADKITIEPIFAKTTTVGEFGN